MQLDTLQETDDEMQEGRTRLQSALEIAQDLTLTLAEADRLSSEDMCDAIQKIHATLLTLKAQEEIRATTTIAVSETPRAVVDWRKSITKHTISCLECGQTFRRLSTSHLSMHGLDARSYRATYGIPRTESLAARDTIARRRKIVQKTRPWEKSPTYRRAQARNGHASPEPEAEAARDEIGELAAAAAICQRKTTPKKSARKKSREG